MPEKPEEKLTSKLPQRLQTVLESLGSDIEKLLKSYLDKHDLGDELTFNMSFSLYDHETSECDGKVFNLGPKQVLITDLLSQLEELNNLPCGFVCGGEIINAGDDDLTDVCDHRLN